MVMPPETYLDSAATENALPSSEGDVRTTHVYAHSRRMIQNHPSITLENFRDNYANSGGVWRVMAIAANDLLHEREDGQIQETASPYPSPGR